MPFVPTKPQPSLPKTIQLTVPAAIHEHLQGVADTHGLQVHEVVEQFLTWAVNNGEIQAKASRKKAGKTGKTE